jgi:hypothetical protein
MALLMMERKCWGSAARRRELRRGSGTGEGARQTVSRTGAKPKPRKAVTAGGAGTGEAGGETKVEGEDPNITGVDAAGDSERIRSVAK